MTSWMYFLVFCQHGIECLILTESLRSRSLCQCSSYHPNIAMTVDDSFDVALRRLLDSVI